MTKNAKEIKKQNISQFITDDATALNTFRSLILFGKNSATYKFAFCHALLLQKPQSEINYRDLTENFLKELYAHYKQNPSQFQSGTNQLTQAMDVFKEHGESKAAWEQLVFIAENIIYNHVFDAFQNVGGGTIDTRYMLFEHDKKARKLVLTNNTLSLMEKPDLVQTVLSENRSRWGIVEAAWQGGLSPNLVEFNAETGDLISIKAGIRINLRSAVTSLLPYQKGRCFYCNRYVSTSFGIHDDNFADVDHFFSHAILNRLRFAKENIDPRINFDSVWNLVIACRACNRGVDGKSARRADSLYYQKIVARNNLILEEHNHSLKFAMKTGFNVVNAQQMSKKMAQLFNLLETFPSWKPERIFDTRELL
jgi:hypothetical protein